MTSKTAKISKPKPISVAGGLRTEAEQLEAPGNRACFERNPTPWETKMENFPKYVRRQNLTRFMALYEIFKQVVNVKGSVVECGVHHGFGVSTWCKLSAILEPVNLMRRVYGFDTFAGFPSVSEKDRSKTSMHVKKGDLAASAYDELLELAEIHDSTRFIGHVPKLELIKGDACKTIPDFIEKNPHVLVSLLYLDFDLYEPTKVALEHFLPRMPKGAIIAFDELDNALWPGETQAMLEFMDKYNFRIQRLDFDPYIGFAVLN
ncbi:MAG: TylF/MycF/NovP-related O-methyltransferase [Sphingomonadales bacterium]